MISNCDASHSFCLSKVTSAAANDIFGYAIEGTGTGGSKWRWEEGRSAPGNLDLSEVPGSVNTRMTFVKTTGAIKFPGPTVSIVHTLATGTAPTLTSGTGTIAGFDEAGVATLTAGSQTSITIAFGQAYTTNIPICTANDATTAALVTAAPTLTTLVLSGTFGAADKIGWLCKGF